MKNFIPYWPMVWLLFLLFGSCSGNDVALYHKPGDEGGGQAEKDAWLLQQIDYNKKITGFEQLTSKNLTYNPNGTISTITEQETRLVSTFYYDNDFVSASRKTKTGQTLTLDTLYFNLNAYKRADYGIHIKILYDISDSSKDPLLIEQDRDSTEFIYDTNGYLTQQIHYKYNYYRDSYTVFFKQNFIIEDGNVVEMQNSTYDRYIYTYDKTKRNDFALMCYFMPINTVAENVCWFLNTMPFFSDYFGTKSQNNVTNVKIVRNYNNGTATAYIYTDADYEYLFDDQQRLSEVKITGMTNTDQAFDQSTMFYYIKK